MVKVKGLHLAFEQSEPLEVVKTPNLNGFLTIEGIRFKA